LLLEDQLNKERKANRLGCRQTIELAENHYLGIKERLPIPDGSLSLYHQNHISIQCIFYSNSIKTHPDALNPDLVKFS